MMDEVNCTDAPKNKEQAGYDWTTGLELIPDQLTIILMFNPGLYQGRRLLLPPSCLRLVLETTYRSTRSISNLHACLADAGKRNAPPGNPGTEVVGMLPGMVPLGMSVGEEEDAEKIKEGLLLLRGFLGTEDVTIIIDTSISYKRLIKLVRKETEAWGWTMATLGEMTGAEADRVVYIGPGNLEAVSRARVGLGILYFSGKNDVMAYNRFIAGFHAAIEEGLVLVATLPSHPQVACNCDQKLSSPLNIEIFPALEPALQCTSSS